MNEYMYCTFILSIINLTVKVMLGLKQLYSCVKKTKLMIVLQMLTLSNSYNNFMVLMCTMAIIKFS